MNVGNIGNMGTPTSDDKNQVKLNQKTGQDIGVGNPKIGVEPENNPAPDKITVSTSDVNIPDASKSPLPAPKPVPQPQPVPIKSYDPSKITDKPSPPLPQPPMSPVSNTPPQAQTPQDSQVAPQPPIKTGSGSPTATITVLAILALVIGTAAGFFGFRGYDKLKTSASTEATPTPTDSSLKDSTGTSTSSLLTYANDKYKFSLQYLSEWKTNTTASDAENIVFASNQESLLGDPSGFRIEINFQDSNGKTLKNWVEANSVAANEKNSAKEITVNNQTAFQQELANIRPAVATYIERQDKIMIITYTAPPDKMGEGGEIYNNLINSLKLFS